MFSLITWTNDWVGNRYAICPPIHVHKYMIWKRFLHYWWWWFLSVSLRKTTEQTVAFSAIWDAMPLRDITVIQSSAVITRSNLVRYCINYCRNWGENINEMLDPRKTSRTSPWHASYGMSFVDIFEKIDRVVTAPHCIFRVITLSCLFSAGRGGQHRVPGPGYAGHQDSRRHPARQWRWFAELRRREQ